MFDAAKLHVRFLEGASPHGPLTPRRYTLTHSDVTGKPSERTVRPLSLAYFGPIWLLAAWCELREAFRNFRVDRIEELERRVAEETAAAKARAEQHRRQRASDQQRAETRHPDESCADKQPKQAAHPRASGRGTCSEIASGHVTVDLFFTLQILRND